MKKILIVFNLLPVIVILFMGYEFAYGQTNAVNPLTDIPYPTVQIDYRLVCYNEPFPSESQPVPFGEVKLDWHGQNVRSGQANSQGKGRLEYYIPRSDAPQVLHITAEPHPFMVGFGTNFPHPNSYRIVIPPNTFHYYQEYVFAYDYCPPPPRPHIADPKYIRFDFEVTCENISGGKALPVNDVEVFLIKEGLGVLGDGYTDSQGKGSISIIDADGYFDDKYILKPEEIKGIAPPSAYQISMSDISSIDKEVFLAYPECPASMPQPRITDKIVDFEYEFTLSCPQFADPLSPGYVPYPNAQLDILRDGEYAGNVETDQDGKGTVKLSVLDPPKGMTYELALVESIPGFNYSDIFHLHTFGAAFQDKVGYINQALQAYACPDIMGQSETTTNDELYRIGLDPNVTEIESFNSTFPIVSPSEDIENFSEPSEELSCESKDWTDEETDGSSYCSEGKICYRAWHLSPETGCEPEEIEPACRDDEYCASLLNTMPAELDSEPTDDNNQIPPSETIDDISETLE